MASNSTSFARGPSLGLVPLDLPDGRWEEDGIPGRPLQQVPWGESRSGTPNAIARSTLFAGNDRPDEYAEDVVLYAQAGYSLKFTGKPLTSYHSLVWQAAVRIMMRAGKQAGETVFFSKSDIVHEMGWSSDGGANLEWAWNALRRLSRSHVEISSRHLDYTGPLLYWVGRTKDEDGPSRFAMVMNPTMVQLFCEDITVIDFERKRELRSDIAMWLHDYLSSHHANRPIAVKELVKLSGHTHLPLFKFRSRLKDAAQRLVDHQRPLLRSFSINDQDEFVYEKAERTFVVGTPPPLATPIDVKAPVPRNTRSRATTAHTSGSDRANMPSTVDTATNTSTARPARARRTDRGSAGDRRTPAEKAAAAQRARVAL